MGQYDSVMELNLKEMEEEEKEKDEEKEEEEEEEEKLSNLNFFSNFYKMNLP